MKLILRHLYLPVSLILTVICFNIIIVQKSEQFLYDQLDDVPKKSTALVLGAAKNGKYEGINPYFKYRMEAAAALFFEGKIKNIIVSGDNHIIGYDEPTDMANYLVELGVPREIIILDFAGFRTLDSVIRAKKVFNCQELIIVSQKFHNQRAVYAARQMGIDPVGYNARDVSSNRNFTHLREFASKFLMILDIHFLNTKP